MNNSITTEEKSKSDKKPGKQEIIDEPKETPIKEYNETLFSKGSKETQQSAASPEKKQPLKRTSWENSDTIEQNVDKMRQHKTELGTRSTPCTEDINKKVDFIFLKKKNRF